MVKSETTLCGFDKVGLEGVENILDVVKFGVHACILNGYPNLWSNFNSANLVKSETPSCGFAKVWLNGGKKSSDIT